MLEFVAQVERALAALAKSEFKPIQFPEYYVQGWIKADNRCSHPSRSWNNPR
jgi:hypothetical protein